MGWNDHMPELEGAANAAALQAGALKACPVHSDVLIDQGDPDANNLAYAIGTNTWKAGGMSCTRQEFMDAIKNAIEASADECGWCMKHLND